jgi:O-antigen ligase
MAFSLFLIWIFVLVGRPQDFVEPLAALRPALVFGLLTAGLTVLGNKKLSFSELTRLKEGKLYLLFYAVMMAGIPFAYYRREAFTYTFVNYLVNMLFFYFFLVHVDSFAKLKKVLFTISLCTLIYGAASLSLGAFAEGRFSFGAMHDSNDLAFFLLSLFPLSLYFVVNREGAWKKLIALAASAVSLLVILLTGSRGGFLGLAVAIAVLLFSKTVTVRPWLKFLTVGLFLIIATLSVHKINAERYASLKEIGSDYNVTSEEGRLGIWKRGIRFVASRPLTGVGVNCFPMALGYAREAEGEAPKWQVAHNAYLQIAAEVGLVGFFLFGSLILQTRRMFLYGNGTGSAIAGEPEVDSLRGLLNAAFAGCLVTGFFLSQGYSILFTLFFSMAAALRALSHKQQADVAAPAPVPRK